jgi:hypothetical protein
MVLKKLFALILVVALVSAGIVVSAGPMPVQVMLSEEYVLYGLSEMRDTVHEEYREYRLSEMENMEPSDDLPVYHPANIHESDPESMQFNEGAERGSVNPAHIQIGFRKSFTEVQHTSWVFNSMTQGLAAEAGRTGTTGTVVNESWRTPADIPTQCEGRSLVYTTELVVRNETIPYQFGEDLGETLYERMMTDTTVQDFFADGSVQGGVGVWAEFSPDGEGGTTGQFYAVVTACESQ